MTIQQAIDIFLENIDLIGLDLVIAGQKELEQQGHRATGKLINSIAQRVQDELNEAILYIEYLRYGNAVNTGVRPSRVPYTQGSGKRTSKFITALAEWVRLKRITSGLDKDVMRATFAIARKMKKEGIPTKGSFRFSKNGRRTGWLDRVEQIYQVKIELRGSLAFEQLASNAIDAVLEDLERRFLSVEIINN